MSPGALIANIGHFKEPRVESGFPERFLKKWFVGPGRTGGHHHPVELMLLDHLLDPLLGILRAGEEILFNKGDAGEAPGVFHHLRDINHPADIDSAVADEYPDPGSLAPNISLGWIEFRHDFGASPLR